MCAATNESKNNATQASARIMEQVGAAITDAESTVGQSVQGLTLVHQARVAQLTRTAATVSARYGASSPQAKAAKAAVTASQATLSRVTLLQKRVSFPTPEAPAAGWVVYGHVYHSTLNPASAYTVFFVDERNAYRQDIGFAYTGPDGSFHLAYAPDAKSTEGAVFLQIVNNKAQPVYLSSAAFEPQVGAANYQDITLPSGEPVLGDPPPAIRAIAMPDAAPGSSTAPTTVETATVASTQKASSKTLSATRKVKLKRTEPAKGK